MSDIKVNKSDWEGASPDEQKAILEGLIQTGALKPGDRILGDTAISSTDNRVGERWNPIKDGCKALCDIAAGTGAAWCTANTVGLGLAACLAAAGAVREKCRDGC